MPQIRSPFVVLFSLSLLLANGISYASNGKEGLMNCWDPWSILAMVPIATLYCLNEMLEMQTLRGIDPTLWKILTQIKLPITAILSFLILGRKQTLPQSITILLISMQVATFSTLAVTPETATGIPMALINICVR
eukprot:GHVP01053208.1.p1 GENE.GHVP01053208.1~~GHVP01053208.1.p1  ORF type:complete len:135 (-),score=17.15 GHVP01053208.1:665-1069(-)